MRVASRAAHAQAAYILAGNPKPPFPRFDPIQLSHAIAVAEAYDLDGKMIARGYRRYEQLMRGATRSLIRRVTS